MDCGPRSRRCCRLHRLDPRVAAGGCVPQRGRRDRLCASDRGALALCARQGAGLRQRRDLLAAAGRVAAGRSVGAAAPAAAGALPRRWWAGLVGGQPGQHQRPGQAWGELIGANPTDRGKPGSKYHLVVDGAGLPLAALVSAANTHDSRLLVALVDRIGPVRGRVGRPRRRPERLYADKAYDFARCRRALRTRGITARIARRGVQSSQRLGRQRWRVERTIAWLLEHRRLQVRYERLAAVLEGLLQLACALMCWRTLATLRGGA
jgi:transposase